jgi:exodeoxyribonuclease V alpha subunit
MAGDTPSEVEGVVEKILFSNEENHYLIAELRPGPKAEKIIITGTMPHVQCGESLVARGIWTRHAKHGPQFKVESFEARLPASLHGIRKYLGSGLVRGIGPAYAKKIVDHFGLETLKVLAEQSGRLTEVDGIGAGRAKAIKQGWDEQRAMREVMIFLQTYGVTTGQCLRLVRRYGTMAKAVVESDPYVLIRDIDGIGFKTADQIALNLGFRSDSEARLKAGLLHCLKTAEEEGHTAVETAVLCEQAVALMDADSAKLQDILRDAVTEKMFEEPAPGLIQLPFTCRNEVKIASALRALQGGRSELPSIIIDKAIPWAEEQMGFAFAPEQRDAVRAALESKLCVITGGPGTGKTTLLRALVRILLAKKVKLVLASPTGRAAQRLSEATGGYAQTLHRLLKFDPKENRFYHREEHPLSQTYIVVDEASMLDTYLAASLLRSLRAGAHLLLVGDADQLPSVGPGNVLSDIMESGFARVVRLQQIFRQKAGSGIVTAAHAILEGRIYLPPPKKDLAEWEPNHDLQFFSAPDAIACREMVVAIADRCTTPAHGKKLDRYAQILAPMHRGECGIGALNPAVQAQVNPGGAFDEVVFSGGFSFRVGDRVMQIRNNYDKNLFNGEMGIVESVDPREGSLRIAFDNETHELDRAGLTEIVPAYAISIHKSQGSEFPTVIIPVLKAHFRMLDRTLIYTALTRGKRRVILVGDPAAYAMAVRNVRAHKRQTDLLGKLQRLAGDY